MRLKMFKKTLTKLGYEVHVPIYSSKSWFDVSREVVQHIKELRPHVVHIFNVPDLLYYKIPSLKGVYFKRLIYDYRSPWDLELRIRFCRGFDLLGRVCEKRLAKAADVITAANTPLAEKVRAYNRSADVYIIPNYPSIEDFREKEEVLIEKCRPVILFLGKVSVEEGAYGLRRLATAIDDLDIWIVGEGPELSKIPRKPNVKFFGWQPHKRALAIAEKADVSVVPRKETIAMRYYTDKNLWKINECLNLGVKVIASGIVKEEKRKNLVVTRFDELLKTLRMEILKKPEPLESRDYRFWEDYCEPVIKRVYEEISSY